MIYPVDSAIQRLNNRGLEIKQTRNWVRSMVIKLYQVYGNNHEGNVNNPIQ